MPSRSTAFAETLFYARMTTAALADSQPQKAAQFAAEGSKKFPNSLTLLQLRAQANLASGQTQAAIGLLEKLLQISPKLPSAWEQLYNGFVGLSQWDSAMTAAHSAVANGEDPTAMSGYVRTQGNNFYKKGNAANPKNVDTLLMAVRWSKYSDSLAANAGAKFIAGVSEFTVGLQYDQDGAKNKDCALIKKASRCGRMPRPTSTVAVVSALRPRRRFCRPSPVFARLRTARESRVQSGWCRRRRDQEQ